MQHDFLVGENGAQKLTKDDLVELTEMLKPSLREPDFSLKMDAGAELVAKLFGNYAIHKYMCFGSLHFSLMKII